MTSGSRLLFSRVLRCGVCRCFRCATTAERKKDLAKKGDGKREDPTAKALVRVCDSLFDFRTGHIPYRDSKITR
jgi:hypothetical protein